MNQETPAAEPMGQFDRLTGALFDPKPAFADIGARPGGWWLPLVLLIVLTAGYTILYGERVGWERFMREQLAESPQAEQLSAEQREQAIRQQVKIVTYLAPVQSVLVWPVLALILGGVFLFVFNVLLGTDLRFRQCFALTCYSLLPFTVNTVVAIVLMFLKDPADFDIQNPVASNLGAFLDPNTVPAWLVSVGGSIDAFSIWVLLLLATAFSAGARKLTWGKALTWVVAAWVVWLVVKGAWAWIWS